MSDFDPDAYIATLPKEKTAFDPDAYLASMKKPGKAPAEVAPDTSDKDKAALTGSGPEALSQHALNGATMGFGNKLQSALYAGILDRSGDKAPFSVRYKEALGRADAVQGNTDKAHPNTALAGDVAGSLVTAPLSLGGGLARTVATGAIQGGAYAMGSSRGGASETAKSVGEGAIAGGVLVGGLHGVGQLASKAYGGARSVVGKYLEHLGTKALNTASEEGSSGLRSAGGAVKEAIASPADAEAAGVMGSEFDPKMESTQARRGMVGGHKNAAANQTDNRLAEASDVASSSDPEAAQFRANNERKFQKPVPGTKEFKSTPEYHNLEGGEKTNLVSRSDIEGARSGMPTRPKPSSENSPPLVALPRIAPHVPDEQRIGVHEGLSDSVGTANARRPKPNVISSPGLSPGEVNRIPSNTPLPKLLKNQPPAAHMGSGLTEDTPAMGAPPPEGPQNGPITFDSAVRPALESPGNQRSGGLMSILGGAYKGSKAAFYPASAAAMVHPKLGAAVGALGAVAGGVKGGMDAMSTAKAYQLTKSAENMIQSADPKIKMYGQALLRSMRSSGADAAGSMTKEKADPQNGQPNDTRNN